MRPFLGKIFGVIAVALLLFHLAEAASTNNTGGCTTYIVQGLKLGLCISNMHGVALPNLFIDMSRLYILGAINCRLYIETWDDQGNMYDSTSASCTTGVQLVVPIGPFPKDVVLHSFARVHFGDGQNITGSSPGLAIQASIPLSFNYKYLISSPPTTSAEQVLRMATHDFQALFPFHDCGSVIRANTNCSLGNGSGFLPQANNPVKFMAIGGTNFTYITFPGHYEGPSRVFTFSFIISNTTLCLEVASSGPWNPTAQALHDSGAARSFWEGYADNLRAAIANGTEKNY
jgi:hypothetical protein